MPAKEPPIYVVVTQNDKPHRMPSGRPDYTDPGGPLVWETYTRGATLDAARKVAAELERSYGACRVARLVFEDHPAFKEP